MTDTSLEEIVMREMFGPARRMEPTDRLVEGVVRQLGPRRRFSTRRAVAVGLLCLAVPAAASALTPVRDAFSDAAGTFSGYFDGGGSGAAAGPEAGGPGRALTSSDTPPGWLTADARTGQRLLAAAGGYALYVVREPSGAFGFALGDTVGVSDSAEGWERQFADNSVVLLGPGSSVDRDGILPLYGVTAGDVAKVQIRYESGAPTTASARGGGFVALAEFAREPVDLVALGRDGATLQRLGLGYITAK